MRGIFGPRTPGFEGWDSLVQKLWSLKKQSTECVSFLFIPCFCRLICLAVSASAPWGLHPPGSAGNHPKSNCIKDQEVLSAYFPRMWLQGIPTDQFDPGLNKEKCVWIRTHVVSFVPSLLGKDPAHRRTRIYPGSSQVLLQGGAWPNLEVFGFWQMWVLGCLGSGPVRAAVPV